jgi:hypothetical protein
MTASDINDNPAIIWFTGESKTQNGGVCMYMYIALIAVSLITPAGSFKVSYMLLQLFFFEIS